MRPVKDFLITFYSHRTGQLLRWHAGLGVVLAGAGPERGTWPGYQRVDADGMPAEFGGPSSRPVGAGAAQGLSSRNGAPAPRHDGARGQV